MTGIDTLLATLPRQVLVASVHEAMKAITHRQNFRHIVEGIRRKAEVRHDPIATAALNVLDAIEAREGRPVPAMSDSDVDPYIRQLGDLVQNRLRDELKLDERAAEATLARLRAAS